MQSRKHSLFEVFFNTAVGYTVGLLSQVLVFPHYGIHVPLTTNLYIGVWFTVISIARGYALRRIFTKHTENESH